MIVRVPRAARLSDIKGASPLNPRSQSEDGDLDGLKASILANGIIDDLLVETRDGDLLALDGSRRWRAMVALAADGAIQPDAEIAIVEIIGTEAEKREIALAANFHRLNLHPVEEYRAFADLVRAGYDEAKIAAHFHIETRDVKKRLALGRLAPEIRDAWKDGKLSADCAQAFTASPDHARQVEILGRMNASDGPATIRRLLRGDAIPATAPIAIFAAEDYAAAGGRIDESLFEEHSHLLDGDLLREVADEKRLAIGRAICEREGWRGVIAMTPAHRVAASADYLDAEEKKIAALQAKAEDADLPDAAKIFAEIEAIEAKAWTRGVAKTLRAQLDIAVEINADGRAEIYRALQEPQTVPKQMVDALDQANADLDRLHGKKKSAPPAASAAPIPEPKKAVRAVLDAAIGRAFAQLASGNVNLALALCVAALADTTGASSVTRLRTVQTQFAESDLLDRLAGLEFSCALDLCVEAPLADLTAAFCAIVARSISIGTAGFAEYGAIAKAMAQLSGVRESLTRALDLKAYFTAATKDAGLSAIRELLGETAANDAAGYSREKIADEAARVASDKGWLPFPLSSWTPALARYEAAGAKAHAAKPGANGGMSLAQAMGKAMDDDVEGKLVERFLDERTQKADGVSVRAAELHKAFVDFCVEEGVQAVPAMNAFGQIATRIGLTKWRHKTGMFYTNMRLVERAALQAAE